MLEICFEFEARCSLSFDKITARTIAEITNKQTSRLFCDKDKINFILAVLIPDTFLLNNAFFDASMKCRMNDSDSVSVMDDKKEFSILVACQKTITFPSLMLESEIESDAFQTLIDSYVKKNEKRLASLFSQFSYSFKKCSVTYTHFCNERVRPLLFKLSDFSFFPQLDGGVLDALEEEPDVWISPQTKALIFCYVTQEIMQVPVRDKRFPSDPCIELSSYLRILDDSGKNPFNRQDLGADDLVIDKALQEAIANKIETTRMRVHLLSECSKETTVILGQEASERQSIEQKISLFGRFFSAHKTQDTHQMLRRNAAGNDSPEEFRAFLSLLNTNGINLDAVDNHPDKGFTALHVAIMHQKIENALCLLESGARYDIKDRAGQTAVDYMRLNQSLTLLRFVDDLESQTSTLKHSETVI